jgi:3-deoxy-7-phosphoheptulonate synthase
MLESNINPGNQSLGNNIDDLDYGVSITDKCVGWEKTEETIMDANSLLD